MGRGFGFENVFATGDHRRDTQGHEGVANDRTFAVGRYQNGHIVGQQRTGPALVVLVGDYGDLQEIADMGGQFPMDDALAAGGGAEMIVLLVSDHVGTDGEGERRAPEWGVPSAVVNVRSW